MSVFQPEHQQLAAKQCDMCTQTETDLMPHNTQSTVAIHVHTQTLSVTTVHVGHQVGTSMPTQLNAAVQTGGDDETHPELYSKMREDLSSLTLSQLQARALLRVNHSVAFFS
eukprot:SAG31_NODE_129_length_23447_cov_5.010922_2_plen_112_part_00